MSDPPSRPVVGPLEIGYFAASRSPLREENGNPVLPPSTLAKDVSLPAPEIPAGVRVDPVLGALAKVGTLLLDLAEQAMKLGVFIADHDMVRTLVGSLCRRAELVRQIVRRLAVPADDRDGDATTLLNDAILSLDGVAGDVEYASELAGEVKIKNQIARARLAVTMAGCSIDEARRVMAAQA